MTAAGASATSIGRGLLATGRRGVSSLSGLPRALQGGPFLEVFAVEDDAAQVCWAGLPPGPLTLSAADSRCTVETAGGPGTVTLTCLPPATRLELWASIAGAPRRRVAVFSTLRPPPGQFLCRFATVNDIHIGSVAFGTLRPMRDEPGAGVSTGTVLDAPPVRCLRAALREAEAWGAQLLVVKGDVTHSGLAPEWDTAGALLATASIPVMVIEGNHDVKPTGIDGHAPMARHGLPLFQRAAASDLPGVRVVVVPTTAWHAEAGAVSRGDEKDATALVADAPSAAVVALHHYPQHFRWKTMHPDGIPGPAAQAFLRSLADANPATLVVAGHSHRHRLHRHAPLPVTEVGSTKDYPGTWAGYAVYEGGIRQVAMRIADPDALAWTERTRRVLGGAWGIWSPGTIGDRCFSLTWPT